MKGGLFLVAAGIVARLGSSAVSDLRGLGRRMPWTAAAFVLGGLGLVGVPGTAGFVTKWYLVLAALERGGLLLAFAILLSSLLAAAYVWRVVHAAYFREPDEGSRAANAVEAPLSMLVPTWIILGATLFFGVIPGKNITVLVKDNLAHG